VTFTVKDQAETIELKKTNKAIVTGAVILEKVDEATKQPLPGAEFELQTQEGKTIKTATMSTDDNGRLAVEKLAPGKYQFVETKAPAGYQLDAKPVTFTIKADQTSPVHVTKTNKGKTIDGLTCTVALRKIDSKTGEGLADATFALQDQRGNVLKENLKTDKTGTLVVSDLEPGKYQLAETEAPKGYILNTKPVTFQLTTAKKRVVTVRKENVKKRTSAKEKGGSQATDTNKSHTTYGSNYSGRNHTYLPKTGEQKSMILVIIGVVVLLLLAGIVYIKRKK
jgi:LPXTG-motif cell wall-anchored protein